MLTLLIANRALVSEFLHAFVCYCQSSFSCLRKSTHFHKLDTMLDMVIKNSSF